MAEMDVKSFVEALNSKRGLSPEAASPLVLIGFVKPSDDAGGLVLSWRRRSSDEG